MSKACRQTTTNGCSRLIRAVWTENYGIHSRLCPSPANDLIPTEAAVRSRVCRDLRLRPGDRLPGAAVSVSEISGVDCRRQLAAGKSFEHSVCRGTAGDPFCWPDY